MVSQSDIPLPGQIHPHLTIRPHSGPGQLAQVRLSLTNLLEYIEVLDKVKNGRPNDFFSVTLLSETSQHRRQKVLA